MKKFLLALFCLFALSSIGHADIFGGGGGGGGGTGTLLPSSGTVNGYWAINGTAQSSPFAFIVDTNTALGPNTSETYMRWQSINEMNGTNCGSATPAGGWNFYKYGDGSGGFFESCNGEQAGIHLDVGNASQPPSGKAELFGGLSGLYTNEYGDTCTGPTAIPTASHGFNQDVCMNRANSVAPSWGETSRSKEGVLQAVMGTELPLSSLVTPDANMGQGYILATGHSNLLSTSLPNATTIYYTNGAVAISSGSCNSGVAGIVVANYVPTLWVVGTPITVEGETGAGTANTSGSQITSISGNNTVYYSTTCVGGNGNSYIKSAWAAPVNGQINGLNASAYTQSGADQWTGVGGTLASGSITASSATLTLNYITGTTLVNHVIDVAGLTGAGSGANGTWPIIATSGLGNGGLQYNCAGCAGSITSTAGTVSTRRYFGGQGRYTFEGAVEAIGVNNGTIAGDTIQVTFSCEDEGTTFAAPQSTSTAVLGFAAAGTYQPFNLTISCIDGVPVTFKAAITGTNVPNPWALDYTLRYQ